MNSKQIYELLQKNEIEKAKQLLLEDICISESKDKNTARAIQRLAKDIQKTAKANYHKGLDGAIYNGEDTFMCDGFKILVIYGEKVNGLVEPTEEPKTDLNYNKLFIKMSNNELVNIDRDKLTTAIANKEENFALDNGKMFNSKWLKLILDCFENPKIYCASDKAWLQVEEGNKKTLLLGIREAK